MTDAQLVEAQAHARSAVHRILRNKSEDEVDDVLQTAALKAYKFRGQFEGRSQFNTYFHRIAVNEALMLLRGRKREFGFRDIDQRDSNEQLVYEPEAPQPSPERRALSSEVKERILKSLRRMSPTVLQGALSLLQRTVAGTSTKKARRHRARVILRHALRGLRD